MLTLISAGLKGCSSMLIIPGPASKELAEKVSGLTKLKICKVSHKYFPDGESYFRFEENIEGKEALIVQGTHPPQERNIFQLILLAKGARELGAKKVYALVPYLCYARQDRSFLRGEVVSLSVVKDMLKSSGIEKVVTVNVHSKDYLRKEGFLKDVDAVPTLAKHISRYALKDPLVVSPGKKGEDMSEVAARVVKGEAVAVKSTRDYVTGDVHVDVEGLIVKGRDVIIIDDIISTGGTVARMVSKLKGMGAKRVYVACVHALMVGNAAKKISNSGADEIVATDTIPNQFSVVSVAKNVSEAVLDLKS